MHLSLRTKSHVQSWREYIAEHMRWSFYKNFPLHFSVLTHIIHGLGLVICFSPTNAETKAAPGWESHIRKKEHLKIKNSYNHYTLLNIYKQSTLETFVGCRQTSP